MMSEAFSEFDCYTRRGSPCKSAEAIFLFSDILHWNRKKKNRSGVQWRRYTIGVMARIFKLIITHKAHSAEALRRIYVAFDLATNLCVFLYFDTRALSHDHAIHFCFLQIYEFRWISRRRSICLPIKNSKASRKIWFEHTSFWCAGWKILPQFSHLVLL